MSDIKFSLVERHLLKYEGTGLKYQMCHICSEWYPRRYVFCVVTEGEYEGLQVCDTCMKDREFDAKLIKKAQDYEQSADKVRQCHLEKAKQARAMLGRIVVPSYQEWKKAEHKCDAEDVAMRVEGQGGLGSCPTCHGVDGYLKVDQGEIQGKRAHATWLYCEAHKTKWLAGMDLITGDASDSLQECYPAGLSYEEYTAIAERVKGFTQVSSWQPEPTHISVASGDYDFEDDFF